MSGCRVRAHRTRDAIWPRVCRLDHDASKDTTWENRGPGPRGTEPELLLGAGNGRQAPITTKKWWFWALC
eukprot:scaffold414128_cov28-Attheya_sp.AAC.1